MSFHLAPNLPWLPLVLAALLAAALAIWAYRFTLPPLSSLARRALPLLRGAALLALLLLLARPVIERFRGGDTRIVVLLDRSRSMDLPAGPDGAAREKLASRALADLRRALRGRASVDVMPFAERLEADTSGLARRGATALGDALSGLARTPEGAAANGVVVISDGAVNAGEDPVAAARALGVPVHAVVVGEGGAADRAVEEVEAPRSARVGEATPVRVRATATDPRGTPLVVRLLEDGRELARATLVAPGGGAEMTAEFRVVPTRPGLALWTARVDPLPGEATPENNAREVAVEVAPGKLGVLVLSGGLNWDLAFLRRALLGDSSVTLTTLARERGGWTALERGARTGAPDAAALRGVAVVVIDALDPVGIAPGFDRALASFVRGGGGVLLLGGPAPGVTRFARGALESDLAVGMDADVIGRGGAPSPSAEARELLQWDDDAARGDRAWRAAAPLSDLAPIEASAADRVLIASREGPPLVLARHIGRGQAVLVNGTGLWRWSLNANDDLSAERGRRLWRRLVRWLAEPVQGEPLRVRPERWLTAGGESVRLFATLQDPAFHPVPGAEVRGELSRPDGKTSPVVFEARESGSYVATLDDLPAGRYRLTARARKAGGEVGRASAEFGVDRWSLETARPLPDSAALAAVATATGGRVTNAAAAGGWARGLETRALARERSETTRLWESPAMFAFVIAALGVEWAWRRRRGLP